MTTNAIDVSTRDLRARKFLPGMYDPGEVTFDILYDPDAAAHTATAAGIVGLQQAGTSVTGIITFPDTTPVQVQINTVAPGMVAEEIERQITFPVELAMGGMPGL